MYFQGKHNREQKQTYTSNVKAVLRMTTPAFWNTAVLMTHITYIVQAFSACFWMCMVYNEPWVTFRLFRLFWYLCQKAVLVWRLPAFSLTTDFFIILTLYFFLKKVFLLAILSYVIHSVGIGMNGKIFVSAHCGCQK